MRARDFLREYNREKTAGVFGNKLLLALQNDKSHALGGTGLGTARAYLQQKDKVDSPVEDSNRTIIINDIMQTLENADPTANKEYVQWLAKVYANENVKLEDLTSKTTEWLQKYDLYKKKRFFTGSDAKLANIMNLGWRDLWDISIRADFQMKIKQAENNIETPLEFIFENSEYFQFNINNKRLCPGAMLI